MAEVQQLGITSIAIPALGCGNGGLDWLEVKRLIESAFVELPIVLLVNGIPLVVIECKSPKLDNPITEASRDLLQYSNQRGSRQPEGAEKLFHYNQLMMPPLEDGQQQEPSARTTSIMRVERCYTPPTPLSKGGARASSTRSSPLNKGG